MSDLDEIRQQRKHKFPLILTAVAGIGMLFIGLPNYMSHNSTAITVNGEEIPHHLYQNMRGRIQSHSPDLTESQLEAQTMAQLLRTILLSQHAEKSAYELPEQELYQMIKNQFGDAETYRNALRQMQTNAKSYENQIRQEQKTNQYYELLTNNQPDEQVLKTLVPLIGQEHSYSVIKLNRQQILSGINPTLDELKNHYEKHINQYQTPEKIDLSYVIFNLDNLNQNQTISDEDLQKALRESEKRTAQYLIYTQLADAELALKSLTEKSASFAELEQQIKDKKIEGETGEFKDHKLGQVGIKEIDEALFAIDEIDGISPIVQTEYGQMILKLNDKQTSDIETAKKALLNSENSEKLYQLGLKALEMVQNGRSIQEISALIGVAPIELKNIEANQTQPEFLTQTELQKQLFGEQKAEVNKVLEPIQLPDNSSLFVVINHRTAPEQLNFDAVKIQVASDYQNEIANQQLKEQGEKIIQDLKAGKSLTELAESLNLTVEQHDKISFTTFQSQLPLEITRQLLSAPEKINLLTDGENNGFITVLSAVQPPSNEKEMLEAIRPLWLNQEIVRQSQDYLNDLASYLQKSAKISINQALLTPTE